MLPTGAIPGPISSGPEDQPKCFGKMAADEMISRIAAGGRLVFFEYCLSFLVATTRRPSVLYVLELGDRAWRQRIGYSLISLVAGWWGFPWGLIYTPIVILGNLMGGCDVTAETRALLEESGASHEGRGTRDEE